MLVTLSGIVTEVREAHIEKALPSMLVTPSGMVTDVREVQFWKADWHINLADL